MAKVPSGTPSDNVLTFFLSMDTQVFDKVLEDGLPNWERFKKQVNNGIRDLKKNFKLLTQQVQSTVNIFQDLAKAQGMSGGGATVPMQPQAMAPPGPQSLSQLDALEDKLQGIQGIMGTVFRDQLITVQTEEAENKVSGFVKFMEKNFRAPLN